jgi:uncharacterized protein
VIADQLLSVLVCPKTKERLLYFPRGESDQHESEAFFVSVGGRLRYRIDDGVPVLLVDEAVELTADAVEALVARARQLGLTVPA